ncbi:unnamed protein product [Nippostrongylus brasiliensis]|uniref:DNA-(apurinic or apyrimidinic site) lyase n=1 Tax=Nippostrongylus brasiliensis TaxID=27835 RepID=A0A0N4Y5Q9_NIPBR|nr:unnamed protein product [Nippostrongylus brasiliensis]
MVNKLAKLYGDPIIIDPTTNAKDVLDRFPELGYAFPTLNQLIAVQPELNAVLREQMFGYRAASVAETVQQLGELSPTCFDDVQQLSCDEIRKFLLSFTGVGPKVAECVALMSLGQHQCVPIDRHVFEVNLKFYEEKFGAYAGWAQAVLFNQQLEKFIHTTAISENNGVKKVNTPFGKMSNPNNMYTPRSTQQQAAQRVADSPDLPKTRMERFRDYIGRTCCSCFLKLPIVVIVIAICILVALLLALIPAVVILTSAVDKEALRSPAEEMQILRDTHVFPSPDMDDDEDLDSMRSFGASVIHGIPSTALFPPNVSLCIGFGFACTNQPHLNFQRSLNFLQSTVISTTLRCDGKNDCPDGSDELNCKVCQSAFSCSISKKSKVKVCLRAEQLCDGITHCPDDYDEEEHCKKTCADDELRCPSTSLCLPSTAVCDGVVDCETEDDEEDCKALCSDGTCLERSRICDGIVDCSDGVDEEDCPECIGNHWNTYMCGATSHCFRRDEVCAPYTLCPNATKADKVFCAGRALRGMDWQDE